ncbi:MAG TPA: cohesin domain-containing protein, partial [Candidatus Bathyarchaeia archaeon]|nr:cohesin domain-containing protein [Candidatus Bathyarchaeia archaeon]
MTVDINVTNAPPFNAYEFSLFYDPTNLTLSNANFATGTLFANPLVVTNDISTPGIIREAVVNLPTTSGNGTVYGSGVLVFLTFNIKGLGVSPLVLAAGTCCPAEGMGATEGDWTRLVLGHHFIDVSTSDGYFQNNLEGKLGPVAKFTFSPPSPVQGAVVTFNASQSFDPDSNAPPGIASYLWDF